MSKLTDMGPVGRDKPLDAPDYCTQQGAALLGAKIVNYWHARGRSVSITIEPVPGHQGKPLGSSRIFRICSDINPAVLHLTLPRGRG